MDASCLVPSTKMNFFWIVLLFGVQSITSQVPCDLFTDESIGYDRSPIHIQVLEESIDSDVKLRLRFDQPLAAHQNVLIQVAGHESQLLHGSFITAGTQLFKEQCNGIVNVNSIQAESIDFTWARPIGYLPSAHFRAAVYDSSTDAIVYTTRSDSIDFDRLATLEDSVYRGCGISKGCHGAPDGCLRDQSCYMMTSYVRNESNFIFEIFGRNKPNLTNFYSAVGFSGDMAMGNDCVVECVLYSGAVKTFMSLNEGYENRRDPQVIIDVVETRYENDTIYCHFNLEETLSVRNFTCDLNVPHHLLLATGPALVAHNIRQHVIVEPSAEKIDFDSVSLRQQPADIYEGCGISKGCHGAPDGCLADKSCYMMTSYMRNESNFIFEIFGRNKPNLTNFYTAVGFSGDRRMGDDCVVECVLYSSTVKAFMSLNEGEENKRDAKVTVDVTSTRYENDTIYCQFNLEQVVTVRNFTCDLNVPHHLFLATGPALVAHSIRQHTHEVVSDEKIDLNSVATEEPFDVYDGCGVSKGCFGAPDGCLADKSCYMMTSYTRNQENYNFEIFGRNKHNLTNFYTAVGFSGANRRMGDDCVVECVLYNSQVKAFVSLNEDEENRRDLSVTVNVLESRYEEDAIYCHFQLPGKLNVRNFTCDLNVPQHLLLATGRAFIQHTMHGHENEVASATEIDFNLPGADEVVDVYKGCGESKGCFGTPEGCLKDKKCEMMTSYVRNESNYIFEIFGTNTHQNSNFYTALGFSGDNRKMGDDCVVECVLHSGTVKTFMSSNEGTHNYRDTNAKVDVRATRYVNDTIYCHFQLEPIVAVNKLKCNLTTPQYLLFATGRSAAGHEILEHSKEVASSQKIDLNFIDVNDAASDDILMRLHGSLMVVAWMVFAPVGIICARYFKPKLKKNVCGKDLWFTIHRSSMVITWLLTLIAFVVIFIEVSGWSSQTAHAVIGCIVTFLVFIQPIMAAFRPLPTAANRPLFNWSHFLVGNVAHVLAITCLFLAVDITHVEASDWTLYVLIAFVIVYCCVHAAMTVTDNVASKRQEKAENTSKPKKFKKWKKTLVVFTVCAVGLSIAVIVGITAH